MSNGVSKQPPGGLGPEKEGYRMPSQIPDKTGPLGTLTESGTAAVRRNPPPGQRRPISAMRLPEITTSSELKSDLTLTVVQDPNGVIMPEEGMPASSTTPAEPETLIRGDEPPAEPPVDPREFAETPDPEDLLGEIERVASIPPNPADREKVTDRLETAVQNLLTKYEDFVDVNETSGGLERSLDLSSFTADYVCSPVFIVKEQTYPRGKTRSGFQISFSSERETEDVDYFYFHRNGSVHRLTIDFNIDLIPQKGEVSARTLGSILEDLSENRWKYVDAEISHGLIPEVSFDQIDLVLRHAEKENVAPSPASMESLDVLHVNRLNGLEPEDEVSKKDATEFTKYVNNYLKRVNPSYEFGTPEIRTGEFTYQAATFRHQTGMMRTLTGDVVPYVELELDEGERGKVNLYYTIVDGKFESTRNLYKFEDGQYVLEENGTTTVNADREEARKVRNYLNYFEMYEKKYK